MTFQVVENKESINIRKTSIFMVIYSSTTHYNNLKVIIYEEMAK